MKNIDVMNLEWPSNERDAHIVASVISALQHKGLHCISGDIFNYVNFLLKYRPKVLLISNFSGATINADLCRLAHSLGIKVISLVSEGNIRESNVEEMTWGHNRQQQVYFDKFLLWSERSRALVAQYYPQIADKLAVSGHTGIDRYRIFAAESKSQFLKQHFADFSADTQVVGLAGWGFDMFMETALFNQNKVGLEKAYGQPQILRFRQDFNELVAIYEQVLTANPDTIFILRRHPGVVHTEFCEFERFKDYPNVYFSQPRVDSYNISDLISISDVWGGYETTTALEAWLVDKETFLVNPSGVDFTRDELYKGSVIYTNAEQVNEFVGNKLVFTEAESAKAKSFRCQLISDVVGFADGGNYLRARDIIIDELNKVTHYPSYASLPLLCQQLPLFIKQNLLRLDFVSRWNGSRKIDNDQVKNLVQTYSISLKSNNE